MAMKIFSVLGITAVLAISVSGPVSADQLADVKARGKLICGTLGTAEPFSFQHPQTRQIVGYDVDLCQKVADALGVPLELKTIGVEARIPELNQGKVYILAANLGFPPEPSQQICLLYSYFVSQ